MSRLLDKLFGAFQRRCKHDGSHVTADVLAGDVRGQFVQWCQRCGAVRRGWVAGPAHAQLSDWTTPRADWLR